MYMLSHTSPPCTTQPFSLSSSSWPQSSPLCRRTRHRAPSVRRFVVLPLSRLGLPRTSPLASSLALFPSTSWGRPCFPPCLFSAGHVRRPNSPVRGDHVPRTDSTSPLLPPMLTASWHASVSWHLPSVQSTAKFSQSTLEPSWLTRCTHRRGAPRRPLP
jgi:hypothetical protein